MVGKGFTLEETLHGLRKMPANDVMFSLPGGWALYERTGRGDKEG